LFVWPNINCAHTPLRTIPASAYLLLRARRAFYDYFELCEQEAYYRGDGQVSDRTWDEWRAGIESNRRKRSFRAAWAELSSEAPEQL